MTNSIIKPDIFIPDEREPYFQELDKIWPHLNIPIPMLFMETQIWSPGGTTIHHAQRRGHSWIRNAYNFAMATFAVKDNDDAAYSGGNLGLKDTGGNVRSGSYLGYTSYSLTTSCDTASGGRGYMAAADVDDFGILVGDDNTAVSIDNYALGSQIASGEGSGELSYTAVQAHDENWVSGTSTLTITVARYFNNNESGEGAVSVEEAGLVTYGTVSTNHYYFLMSRDLTGSLSVPYQGQLKVSYAISLVFSL